MNFEVPMADTSDIVQRLEAIAEDLAQMSIAILTEAVQNGQTTRPVDEKILSQARRAIEKAIFHLGKDSSNID